MDSSDVTQLFLLLFLLLLSAFFSSAETSLTTVNKIRMRNLAEEGVKKAQTVCRLIEHPSKMISAILIGNNIVNLYASSIATTLAIKHFQAIGPGIVTGLLTLIILIFGEITPKSMATLHAEKLSLLYGGIISLLTKLLTPVIYVVNQISRGILVFLRIDPNAKSVMITENELRTILDVSHEEGVIEQDERKMITNVVDFGDSLAKDVMIPRIDVEFASVTLSYDELVDAFSKEKYTRMPVYCETIDNIVGIVNLKDVFFYQGTKEDFSIEEIMREPYFTYEYKKTSELLREMKNASSISVAIVLDEYGATAGLLTVEDLIEEIVGEIRDEYDEDEVDSIRKISDSEYLAEGNAKLDDINELLHLDIESDDYDSIAGHIINLLEHIPIKGEQVTEDNITYVVEEIDKNRIDTVRILINSISNTAQA